MATNWKQWEKPLIELEEAIEKLKQLSEKSSPERKTNLALKIKEFSDQRDKLVHQIYTRLSPWEKVLIARAEPRPYTLDYIHSLFTDFIELEGDRRMGADPAILSGFARFQNHPCLVLGHQKGRNIQERQKRNFGMARPQGYRKAIRLMDLANRMKLPIFTFVDTPAADPSVESEAHGISEAIAASMLKMFELEVPIITVVIGEGGSGGGLGIGIGNKVFMLEHSVYSVIPPEGCSAILWKQADKAPQAAMSLKLTAQDALEHKLIDAIIPEPFGGAHRNPLEIFDNVRTTLQQTFQSLQKQNPAQLKEERYKKFRYISTQFHTSHKNHQ